jgi:hypothetical protein
MPKIPGNGVVKFNKSCSALHEESNKIEFAFFRCFYDFLEILQESEIWLNYWRCTFQPRPLEVFKVSHKHPSRAPRPSGKTQSSHICPYAAGWARRRRWPAGPGHQAARDPLGAHLGSIGGVGRRGPGSSEDARRRSTVAAATGCGSGGGEVMSGNVRRRKLLQVIGRRFGRLEALGKDGGQVHWRLAMAGAVDCGSSGGRREEERRQP